MSLPIRGGTATHAAPPAQASEHTHAAKRSPEGRHCWSPSPPPVHEHRFVSCAAQAGERAPCAQATNARADNAARTTRVISVPQLLLPRLAVLVGRERVGALVRGHGESKLRPVRDG